jgi:hypothetical protein
MKDVVRDIFDSENFAVLRDLLDFDKQTKIASKALRSQPSIFTAILSVYKSAPYIVFTYLFIGGIDIQYRILPTGGGTIWRAVIITIVLSVIANILCYVEAHNKFVTAENRIEEPLKYAVKKAPAFIGVIFGSALLVMMGTMMFVIPGIYIAIRVSLAPAACIIENESVRGSIKRSFKQTKKEGEVPLAVATLNVVGIIGFTAILLMLSTTSVLYIISGFIFISITPLLLHTSIAVLYMYTLEDSTLQITPRETPELLRINKKPWKS